MNNYTRLVSEQRGVAKVEEEGMQGGKQTGVDLCLKWTMFEKAKKRQEVGTVTKRTPKTKSFRCMHNRPNHGMHRYSEKKESTKLKSKNR